MILRLNNQQLQLLLEETRRTHPIEACALLFGTITRRKAVVNRVILTPNVLKSTIRFEIDPKTFYESFKQASENGLEFIGFFHSHPASASPSGVDLEFMRLWEKAVWLILSSIDHNLAAFQMLKGRVKKVFVVIDKS